MLVINMRQLTIASAKLFPSIKHNDFIFFRKDVNVNQLKGKKPSVEFLNLQAFHKLIRIDQSSSPKGRYSMVQNCNENEPVTENPVK